MTRQARACAAGRSTSMRAREKSLASRATDPSVQPKSERSGALVASQSPAYFQAMRWLLLVLFISQAAGQDGPPPPRHFGPDTYRTGGLITGDPKTAGLSCDGSEATGWLCNGFLASGVDGTLLDVSVNVPAGSGPHPVVVLLHGWGGSKGSDGYLADPLAKDNAVLRYSARGFGESWGQVNLADINVELQDLRSMIGQVLDMAELHLNPGATGVIGISYGGGQTWLSLLE